LRGKARSLPQLLETSTCSIFAPLPGALLLSIGRLFLSDLNKGEHIPEGHIALHIVGGGEDVAAVATHREQ